MLYWLRWHLDVETSLSTVNKQYSGSQYYSLGMWRPVVKRHWSCSSAPTDCLNSPWSGLTTQNIATTGRSSRLRMSRLFPSMWWRFYGQSGTGPLGWRNGIPLLCITSLLSIMTYLITWMTWCELWPRKRPNGRKTDSSLWSVHGKSYLNIILKFHQRLVCSLLRHISWIRSGSCSRLGRGKRAWISILKTSLLILSNNTRSFWSMWIMNTAQNIHDCRSLSPTTQWRTLSALLIWLLDLVNLLMIHTICPAMTTNTKCLPMWPKRHTDAAMVQHVYWQLQRSVWIHFLNYHRAGCKVFRILMIPPLT